MTDARLRQLERRLETILSRFWNRLSSRHRHVSTYGWSASCTTWTMARTSFQLLLTLLGVAFLALPARAQCPSGRFELEGDLGGKPLKGTLRLERKDGGFQASRRARTQGGRLERSDGVAVVGSGVLSLVLNPDGIVASLRGTPRDEALQVRYRIEDDGSLTGEVELHRDGRTIRGPDVRRPNAAQPKHLGLQRHSLSRAASRQDGGQRDRSGPNHTTWHGPPLTISMAGRVQRITPEFGVDEWDRLLSKVSALRPGARR